MKNVFVLMLVLLSNIVFAHTIDYGNVILHRWSIPAENKTAEGSFYMYKNENVYVETANHEILSFPMAALSKEDQGYAHRQFERIVKLNQPLTVVKKKSTLDNPFFNKKIWIAGILMALLVWLFYRYTERGKRRYLYPMLAVGLLTVLYSFTTKVTAYFQSITDPAFIDSAFTPFKPNVNTYWDANYFYVESKGIPDHPMMAGITAWQQQVPIPQCYIGNNAWSIPLNPVIATTPVPVNPQHFYRGAIAIAANGVPIFNPYTNTGVDAFLTGQLDNWGGHCGRADDYHYHIAPLSLYNQTSATLPIAFGLDGFAVYGSVEPDGSPMNPLDTNHGHFGMNGVYHYHGSPAAPYMIGNMVGVVTEDTTHQIVPQAAAHPVRPSLTPLNGAVITNCQPNPTNNGYTLTYTLSGQTDSVVYSWTNGGQYTFDFYTASGHTTQHYNGFAQCQVPTSVNELTAAADNMLIYPNPASDGFFLGLDPQINQNDILDISIYNLNGDLIYKTESYRRNTEIKNISTGIYLVKIQLAGHLVTKKLVVK